MPRKSSTSLVIKSIVLIFPGHHELIPLTKCQKIIDPEGTKATLANIRKTYSLMVEGNANIHMNQIMESNPEVEKISQNSSDYSSGYYSETDEFTDFANAIDKEFGQNFENSQISLQAEIPKEITNNKQDIESSLPESVLKTLDSFWLESDDSFFENESDIFSFDDYSQ